ISGPTGAMAVVLVPIVGQYGVGAIALVGLLAGALLLIAGALRLGQLISLVPWPVIAGFTAGIGVIIFLQQVPLVLGVDGESGTRPVVAAYQAVQEADWSAVGWPLVAVLVVVALMVVVPRISPQFPVSLLAIALVTVVVELMDLPLPRIGEIPSSLPLPTLPNLDPGLVSTVFTA